jgi:hypothetical protein
VYRVFQPLPNIVITLSGISPVSGLIVTLSHTGSSKTQISLHPSPAILSHASHVSPISTILFPQMAFHGSQSLHFSTHSIVVPQLSTHSSRQTCSAFGSQLLLQLSSIVIETTAVSHIVPVPELAHAW